MTDLDRLDVLAEATTGEPWDFADWLTAENHEYIAACDPATIRSLVAAVRQRDELRAALIGLDVAFQWIENEYPKALTAMPSPLFSAFFKARAALHREDGAS